MKKLLLMAALLLMSSPALADPCEAKLPHPKETFSGVVRYVGDGDSLCVGKSKNPKTWIEVRLADFYAPELYEKGGAGKHAKEVLKDVALGKSASCVAKNRTYDRIAAFCSINGQGVGNLLRARGVEEGGRGFKP